MFSNLFGSSRARLLLGAGVLLLIAPSLLFWPYRFDDDPAAHAAPPLPPVAESCDATRVQMIPTASARTPEAFTVQGGSLLRMVDLVHAALLVRHPRGTFLFDSGLGREVDEQFQAMPFYLKPFFAYENLRPAVDQLATAGIQPDAIDFVALSHMHWDHASGLEDFPQSPVRALPAEIAFAREAGGPPAYIPSQYDAPALRFQAIELNGPAYGGFERSHDLFGDGCVIFVELPGHSPGSLGMFLNRGPEERYLFIGDLTWTRAGIERPAEKFMVSRLLVDRFPDRVAATIHRLRALVAANPKLRLVPAHDAAAYQGLPVFPDPH